MAWMMDEDTALSSPVACLFVAVVAGRDDIVLVVSV